MCENCGVMLDKGEKTCPLCGAKNKENLIDCTKEKAYPLRKGEKPSPALKKSCLSFLRFVLSFIFFFLFPLTTIAIAIYNWEVGKFLLLFCYFSLQLYVLFRYNTKKRKEELKQKYHF